MKLSIALALASSVGAVRLGFLTDSLVDKSSFATDQGKVLDVTMNSIKESEKMMNLKMDTPQQEKTMAMTGLKHPLYKDEQEVDQEESLSSLKEAEKDKEEEERQERLEEQRYEEEAKKKAKAAPKPLSEEQLAEKFQADMFGMRDES